jgi:cytochrome c peroxidase
VPGIVQSRTGSRKPMTISYAWFVPSGPTFWRRRQGAWEGGFFADGRAQTLEDQASVPMLNPNEMDNVVHGLASPDLVVRKILAGTYTNLFTEAFGNDALTKSSDDIFRMIRQSIAAYEKSRDVSPFSSKYDAYVDGQTQLNQSEFNGLRLFTGSVTGRPGGATNYKNAQCVTCHTISDSTNGRRDFFTNWTVANIGVPKNPRNPFYKQTKAALDPQGYNPDGDRYIDLGLGAILYPQQNLPPGNIGPHGDGRGDFLEANGEFRVPSLRNVDKRPYPDFVKCYMHNGVFKSLKDVVHFYNTRNLTRRGEIIDLANATPYANLKSPPLWPMPEYPSAVTLQNPAGHPNSRAARVGNLGLTDQEEDDLVAFLQTLSDGYFTPVRRRPPPPN